MQPDMITFAKGVTSGAVPMGGVFARKPIYDAFMTGRRARSTFPRLYLFGHPLACAAALATIDLYRDERLFERAKALEPKWYDAIMGLGAAQRRRHPLRRSDRRDRLVRPGSPGERDRTALDHAFFDAGITTRPAGDTIELTPPLIVSEEQIGEIMDKVGASIKAAA